MTLNLAKCKFAQCQLKVLGHIISANGISIDSSKISDVVNWPFPRTGKDIQSFLGLLNYFRDFIPRFADISYPLDQLRHKETIDNLWSNECQTAFDTLRHALDCPPILCFPDYNKPFFISSDASSFGIGAVIFQTEHPDDFKSNPKIIKFASRALKKSEKAYIVYKRELLAIVYALKKFESYIYGQKIIIISDHKPLTALCSQENLSELQITWFDVLIRFDYKIIYVPGKQNLIADMLSRMFPDASKLVASTLTKLPESSTNSSSVSTNECEKIALAIRTGFTIPSDEEKEKLLLEEHLLTHEGPSTLYKKIVQQNFYWKTLKDDCHRVCSSCPQCQRFTIKKCGYHPQRSLFALLPMDHIVIDLFGPLPKNEDAFEYVLIAIDVFSRFIFLRPLLNKSALSVSRELFKIFAFFGPPQILQSDNGLEFNNELIQQLSNLFSTQIRHSTPYYPQCNGIVENAVKSTKTLIAKEIDTNLMDWSKRLDSIQLKINLRITDIHKSTPFTVMFARLMNSFKDYRNVSTPLLSNDEVIINNRLNEINSIIYPSIQEVQKETINKRNEYWNASHNLIPNFPIGSMVMVKHNNAKTFQPIYLGPYLVVKHSKGGSYQLADFYKNVLPRKFSPAMLKLVTGDTLTKQFYVDNIVDIDNSDEEHPLFKVRWFGYPPSADSWEPLTSFDNPSFPLIFLNNTESNFKKGSDVNN